MASSTKRARVREVLRELHLGRFPTGSSNTLTDVPGVLVSTHSIHSSQSSPRSVVNTGVTVIVPRKDWYTNQSYAGYFSFNGVGEMTASHWLAETGLLQSPIVLTNSIAIGAAYDGIWKHAIREYGDENGECDCYPVVAETWDGYLNDFSAFAVTPADVDSGILAATSSPVQEGNTGGGTGMICHRFKGGTGSASRILPSEDSATSYTIACLSQCNYGLMRNFHVGGKPIGRWMIEKQIEPQTTDVKRDGSIIVVLATDAPLHPLQLQRLARRATVGIARVGGYGMHGSGDIFIAFSTAGHIPRDRSESGHASLRPAIAVLHDESLSELFEAAADLVEESIYNAICMAETMRGPRDRVVEAIDLDELQRLFRDGGAHVQRSN